MQDSYYMNSLPDRRRVRVRGGCSIGRSKIYQLIGVSLILMCIIQTALNVYLWHESVGSSNSLNISTCNHTLMKEVRAVISDRDPLLKKEQDYLKQIDQLLQEKNEVLEKNKQLNQDQVKLQTEVKQLNQEKCQIYQEKNKLQQEKDSLERTNKKLEDRIVEKENQTSEVQKRLNMVEAESSECPLGWQRFMSSCYQLSTEPNIWMYAKQNCESKGAQLMVLNDETEQRPFIGGVVKIWIGLYGQTEDNTSFWYLKGVDGRLVKSGGSKTLKPQFWSSLSQSCVYMDHSRPCLKTWSMGTCMEKFYWICEKQMNTTGLQLH